MKLLQRYMLAAALALVFVSSACAKGSAERAGLALGTVCSIRILDGASERALDEAFARLAAIEEVMSANKEGTVVAAINASAGMAPVKAPKDLRFVVEKALWYAQLSGGAFDPTIGPVVKLWNIGLDGERVPMPREIEAALPLVGYRGVELDDKAGTIYLSKKGMLLDLGAIAKGYAADEVGRILLARGVKAAVIDLGGNVKVVGRKKDGSKWRIGVQNPFNERGSYIGIAALEGSATVVTSGIYERFFTGDDGRHYHHILDSATGYPVAGTLVSVTIISSSSIDADGLSTTVFALGLDRGMALIESLDHVDAVFIDEDKRVFLSSGARKLFTLSDASFTLAN
ncbi:MAG TPA: thiamine biosynthesis protein ApbE [Spirochaetaceae bacterium]|jgi:thiamine biosynthesis lipoprotein|nr:thiamine biosynthesis protein ApbE [Spirochaetaceae bacterium]